MAFIVQVREKGYKKDTFYLTEDKPNEGDLSLARWKEQATLYHGRLDAQVAAYYLPEPYESTIVEVTEQ